MNLAPCGSKEFILLCISSWLSSELRTTELPDCKIFLPKNVPPPFAKFKANCKAKNDLPIPPTLDKTPGALSGIKRSTNHSIGGGLPTRFFIAYRFIPKPKSSISSLTLSNPCCWCRSLKSPMIEGNFTTELCTAFTHSSAFCWPTPFLSLSKAIMNLACVRSRILFIASKPKVAEKTTTTGKLVAKCTLTPVATPSTTTIFSKVCICFRSKPMGKTFPFTSLADTNFFLPFLSIY